jgi:two-component system, NarL family, sensor kinase
MAMNLKYKMRVIAYAPIGFAAIALLVLSWIQYAALLDQQATVIKPIEREWKSYQMHHYVQLAMSAMGYDSGKDDEATQEEAKRIVRELSYGRDGYFYVYDLQGRSLVHPRNPEYEGRDILNGPDTRVAGIIRDLLAKAREGGGPVDYDWLQPSTQLLKHKMGYVVLLERWGWMLGTGLYDEDDTGPADSVEKSLKKVEDYAASGVRSAIGAIVAVSLAAILFALWLGWRLKLIQDEKRRPLVQRTFQVQEMRRRNVAMKLHDDIVTRMTLANGELRKLATGVRDDALRMALNDVLVRETAVANELRTFCHTEVDADDVVQRLGLADGLRDHVERFQRSLAEPIEVDFSDVEDVRNLTRMEATALYRVAQEALHNVRKHAGATRVKLTLRDMGDQCDLRVSDNGRGFPVRRVERDPRGGIGLSNMRERVEQFGGRFSVSSRHGLTEIRASIPTAERRSRAVDVPTAKGLGDGDGRAEWAGES